MPEKTAQLPANTVDEHVARFVAGYTVLLASASLYGSLAWLIAVLAVDFLIRALAGTNFSPLAVAGRAVVRLARLTPKPVYAPPKSLAAQIGATLTVLATVLHASGLHAAAVVVTILLVAAASLEAFAGVCVACWVHPYVFRRGALQRGTGV